MRSASGDRHHSVDYGCVKAAADQKSPGKERSSEPELEQIAEPRMGSIPHKRVVQDDIRHQISFGLNNTT
jgi:hypothetical protein